MKKFMTLLLCWSFTLAMQSQDSSDSLEVVPSVPVETILEELREETPSAIDPSSILDHLQIKEPVANPKPKPEPSKILDELETKDPINKDTEENEFETMAEKFQELMEKEDIDPQSAFDVPYKRRYFGVNAAPLFANFIPFNESRDLKSGSYNMTFYRVKPNRRMFRFGLGIKVEDDFDQNDHINLRIGTARVFQFHEKWRHYRGLDFRLFVGSFNLPDDGIEDNAGIGIAPIYGLEYEILPRFSISTETSLFMGITFPDGDPRLTFKYFPPFSLYLNIRFQ